MAPNRRRTAFVMAAVAATGIVVGTLIALAGHKPTAATSAPPPTTASRTVRRSAPSTTRTVSSRPHRTRVHHPASVNHHVKRHVAAAEHRTATDKRVRHRRRPSVPAAPVRHPRLPALLMPPSRTWTVQANAKEIVYAQPGIHPLVSITPTTVLGALWMPVYRVRGAWEEIGLPGPPNGMTGWVQRADVHQKLTHWSVVVSLSRRTETVYHSGRQLAEAPVAVGAPDTPTPTGHTFIDGDLPTVGQFAVESPVLRPLALNSTSQLAATEIGGTLVALHGWEDLSSDPGVFGYAVSHGCIRAPAGPLTNALQEIPTGSPVWVEA